MPELKTIGFTLPRMNGERRVAILPADVSGLAHATSTHFENGYGQSLGITDSEYKRAGGHIVSRREALSCDVVCSPKPPNMDDLAVMSRGQSLFGWLHCVQDIDLTDMLIDRKITAIAWENMYEIGGRHSFWRNNQLAGEAAILGTICHVGRSVGEFKRAAIIGHGNCAAGAIRLLEQIGCHCTIYDRKSVADLPSEIGTYDIVVNAVKWDVLRESHLVTRADLANMRPGAVIVDVSCDEGMGIETSSVMTIENPVYVVDGILHYVVPNTASILHRSASESISAVVARYADTLIEGRECKTIADAVAIRDGQIVDQLIARFQGGR